MSTIMEQSFNKAIDLIYLAKQNGVEILLNDNRLQLKVSENQQVDENLLARVRENKEMLIDFLKNDSWKSTVVPENYNQIIAFDRGDIKHIPLSFSQERLWFIHQLEGSVQYHSPAVFRLKGPLDFEALTNALKTIVSRHEALRTVVLEDEGQVYQHIQQPDGWNIIFVDGAGYINDTAGLQSYIRQLVVAPFDLSKDYMLRAHLVSLSANEHVLVVTMHHIASDAWSIPIIVQEVVELYSAFKEGRKAKLSPFSLQFADYALWQRNHLQGDVLKRKLNYWKEKLEGALPLQLPTDFPAPLVKSNRGAYTSFKIEKELSLKLNELGRQQGASLFMTLLAAFKILLSRYSNQQDISVGTSIANRPQQELEKLIGFFVNTLSLRDEINTGATFLNLLQQVKTTTLEAYENQDIPFEKIVETVVKERESARSPLFQVMLVLINTPEAPKLRFGEVELSTEPFNSNISKFDLTLFFTESSQGLSASVMYSTDLYKEETVRQMMMHFRELLNNIIQSPKEKIGKISMLPSEQRLQLLQEFSPSVVAYPKDKSIVDLFEEQVIKNSGNTAIVFGSQVLTYHQLNMRSNQLAHYLRSEGVNENSLVPLYIERSAEMMIGIVGIMKAGAAYVPIDTGLPSERVAYMLADTGSSIIVSSLQSSTKLPVSQSVIISIDGSSIDGQPTTNLTIKVDAGQLAYVIYTSGSTGQPKGVMIEHKSLVDYYFGLDQRTGIHQCSSFALVSSIATDLGNTVIYGSLLSGGALHVFSTESVSNIEYLHKYFSQNSIDCLKIVPSHWKALSGETSLLPKKLLIFGGEALPAQIVESILQGGSKCKVFNHYGPTETTIGKLINEVSFNSEYNNTIPIGKPFCNTNVYVLTTDLELCPVGVAGQLYISGDGLARGYFNNEVLTREKFIPNPFSANPAINMYSTGDLVKWLPDGNIHFIGRVDDQVKIRGYRVEPGEIEGIISQSPHVKQSVVLAKDDKQGNKKLVAYIVPVEDFDKDAILDYLQPILPDYMIPSVFVEIEAFPLTANGKVNRKALPDPDTVEPAAQYVAPRNQTESKLSAIWQDVLELDTLGIHDDFFALGGHSLLAVRLISAIRKAFDVEMPISDIFDYPTVALLAAQIMTTSGETVIAAIKAVHPRPAHIPLSFSQERLWFIDRLEGSVQYHVPFVLRLNGPLNREAMEKTLQEIVNRHEVLRTTFLEEGGEAYQYIKNKDGWKLSYSDGAKHALNQDELRPYIQQLIAEPFDLAVDYMLRAHLIAVSPESHVLVVTLHHIASDGWSTSIFVKEIVELYKSFDAGLTANLPILPIQYADFAIWQRDFLQGEVLTKKLSYWKSKLEGVEQLQLPADFPRPLVQSTKGARVNFNISKELAAALQDISRQEGATMFMTLLSAFNVLLHRYSGQQDICIGSPTAGRQQQELESLIGFFVNMLALRTEVDGSMPFTTLLKQVRSTTMEAYGHQEVPFEKVVDAVVRDRNMSRNPLFQVMFVLRNTPDVPELKMGGLQLSGESYEHTTALFDMTLFITESENGLQGSIVFCTDLYTYGTINLMISHFRELLTAIVKQPNQRIGAMPMLTSGEEQHLLVDFNNTLSPYPADKNVTHLFEEQVLKTPGSTAVIFEGEQLTYNELNERSNQLAHYLKSKGVTNETLVPICIERGIGMLVGILGIAKAGGVFVPIDPEYPLERINYMLEDTGATMVVCSKESRLKLATNQQLEFIEIDGAELLDHSTSNLPDRLEPSQLIYLIYTSGSTGKPKGVMIQHNSVVNLLTSIIKEVGFTPGSVFLSVTTFSFDISYLEFFVPLLTGGKLIVVPREVAIDGYQLANRIAEYGPTHMQGTPATWQLLLDSGWKNENKLTILIGGEAVKETIKEQLTQIGDVFNLYGPTETTIWSSIKKLSSSENVLIGKPIANTSIYILNKQLQLCLPKVAGEICIGGHGLARGYLNRADLTNEKFINNPFSTTPGDRLYKTGDLGRWLPDGNIEYLGRMDDQVKVRGYRIELGEIETVLQQSDMVRQAIVIARESNGGKHLVSYFVPDWQAVKTRERDLYFNQVATWKEVYETEYTIIEPESGDEEFDINIWKDSFTSQPIPVEQMQVWLNDIVQTILEQKPVNVLEIGTGTGLIFYKLAGKIKKYIGTDFSRASIERVGQRVAKGLREYGDTEFHVCAAHELVLNDSQEVDTIVLNSVAQYFPGEQYMDDVIAKSITLLKGKGRIVIGDLRDLRLLESFKLRLELQKLQHAVPVKELTWLAEQEVLKEEELCFSPEYFYRLPAIYPQISFVEIKLKQGDYLNELSKYRYNVVLHLGEKAAMLEPKWHQWQDVTKTDTIFGQLQNAEPVIAFKDAPNPRLNAEKQLNDAINNKIAATVGELVNEIAREDAGIAEMKQIISLAENKGYHLTLLPNEDPFKVNVFLERKPSGKFVKYVHSEQAFNGNTAVTNIPLFTEIASLLQKDLRQHLQNSLPEYMVPGEFIAIAKLPLTNNGKIDRRFLIEREDNTILNKNSYEAPRNDIERALVNIWEQLLIKDKIGIHDNFFELGGHSLLATRTVSAVRKKLALDLFIKDLFVHPTIAQLATHLGSLSNGLLLPPIEVQQRPQQIPLSFSQERLWFIDRLEGTIQYHIPVVLRLNGKLDIDALTNSLKQVVNRHEALRTIILENDGVAYQQVMQEDMLPVSFINGLQFEMQGELKNTILSLVNEPFDLGKDHMLRVALISLNDLEHVLVVTMHHIASDGWSIAIIVKEVVEFYDAYISNRPAVLPPLSIQYADYSIWQRKYLDGDVLERKISYWKEKLKGTTPLQLPLDYTRPAVQSTRGANTHFRINKELSNGLQLLSQQQGATLFMTLLAAFKILMHRYSGQDDICVGTPIAGRQQQEIEDLIGFFVNTLALRTQVDSSASFTTLLQKVKDTTLEAYANQEIPFEKVVEVLVKERDMGRSPLLQVMFILQNTPDIPALQLGDIQLARETAGHHTSKFEITFNIVQSAHGLDVTVEYCTDLFKTETIVRMIGHFEELLNAIIKEPAKGVGLLTMLKTAEKEQLLNGFNDTQVVYNRPATIPSLFEEQVVKTPEGIAAVFQNKQLTYRELNERSNQLAHFLRSKGIKDEMLVPICLERSIEMIVGIMGILKAGGAYVPIDPEYPNERIGYMLNDLSANIILCSKSSKEKLAFVADLDTIELDGDLTIIGNQPSVNLCLPLQSHHLAYVIYTSGSTGMPKGAMNEHGAVTNRLLWAQDYFNVGSTDSILQKTTFSFDVSVWELLLPLISGARLVFATPEGNRDNEYLKQTIEAQNITIVHFVPSMLDIFLPALQAGDCAKLQKVLCSGEALKPGQVALFKQKLPATALYNLYGPTEAAVDVTYWNVPTNQQQVDMVPIGKPVANTTIYILDKQNNIAPTGCSGEIHIGGVQVGRGYLNRPDLTAERFINDPFSSLPGARLYKTGDNGRWLPDGNIEYLGRIDTQVKIRGYRIELGEIENVLLGCSGVSQCAVLAKEDSNGNNRLVGYIVPEGPFDREAIINYLKEKLPAYMVPSLWVPLDELPLTASGKIDRKALPSPDAQVSTGKYIAARTAAERKLVKIWQEILKVDLVGVEDNFFELGGHSLLAMRVVSMVRKEMEVELAIKHLFAFPSIAVLAQHIESQTRGLMLPPVDVQFRPDLIPLSFSQERLWFIDRFEGSVQYHMPAILELKGKLDTGSLTHTLQNIVNRHEVLRTLILENEGVPHQVIMPKDGLQVSYIDGSGYRKDSEGLHKNIRQLINIPFDLSKDHMLRAAVITLEQDIHILVVTIHHIASDGWSISIIVKEVMELYSAFKQARTDDLAPMDIQYADYAIWQRKYIDGEILEKKLSYWKRQLQGVAPLQLPLDYARPAIQSMKGASGAFRIDKELSSELVSLSKQQGTTLFMTLLAAFNVLLHRYSGQEDICIGTPIAGRQQKELEDLVGFFVNTLALRSAVDGDSSFIDLLQQVRATTLEAYDHQEVPFEKVVEAVVKTRETSRSPLFQVMFILQNTEQAEDFQLDELELKRLSSKNTTTKFELTFSLTEFSDGINGTVEYSSDLYSEQTIQKMVIHFKALLRAIVTTPGQKIAMLPMLTQSEEQQLLFTFNETAKAYPRDKSIVDLFEEQVAKTPNRVSVVFNGVQLTYGELNEQANEFAHYLISMGVNENDLVPICIERSIEMVIGVIAILKAGAAYVPIDPEYPLERISYMLGDIDAQLIITKKAIRSSILHHDNINIVEIDGDWKASGTQVENPSRKYHPDQLAYLIYTSGSTGRPKGVKMPGGAVVNLLNWQEKQFFNKKRRVLQFASLNFDVSFQEIFSTLCFGSTLYLIDAERRKDAVELLKDIVNFEITHLFVPYIVLKNLAESIALMSSYDALWLEEVIVAGEQLKLTEDILFLLKRNIGSIINQYGPTEAHVVSSYKIDMYGDLPVLPPIGKPIDNTRLYILGSNQQLVPTRVSGELYIGGVQVAHGYLNQPEQTVEKFIPDFFSNDPTARLYKTGDMARWLPDGNIEYLGRIDDQVKIRGFRVELGEIESTLQQSGLVKSAAVLAKADNTGTNKLIAYVVPDGTFDKDALQAFLKTKLPDFMVPASWVVLESLPVTHNGKLDKKALPEPDAIELSGNQYVAPRNELEEKLASIWQEILQVERVGIFDNFFELGGHSLLIMRLVSAIRKKLDLNLLINDIFIYPTIADFTNNMVEKFKNPSLPVVNNKYLVPIKSSGNKLPLYIVAGGGGTARRFIKFAEMMDADQPVYVLQPPIDLNELKEFPDTIEKIAGKFIEEIMTRNPEGPYALSGHCLGGVIAFEMARQLKLVGKKVHMLAMFDTVMRKRERRELANFRNMYNMPLHLKRFISKAVIKFDFETYLLKKHPKKALQYKVKSFKHLFKRIKRKKSTADELEYVGLEIFNESSDAYVAAGRKFKIIPYDGELILFYAKERYYFTDVSNNIRYKKVSLNDDVKNIWRNYASSVSIYEVEGDHSDMFEPVWGDKFALILQQQLDKPINE